MDSLRSKLVGYVKKNKKTSFVIIIRIILHDIVCSVDDIIMQKGKQCSQRSNWTWQLCHKSIEREREPTLLLLLLLLLLIRIRNLRDVTLLHIYTHTHTAAAQCSSRVSSLCKKVIAFEIHGVHKLLYSRFNRNGLSRRERELSFTRVKNASRNIYTTSTA